ncbi:MAG TPA: creatininase family protein [Herpetosiphonaceae bacterium]
MSYGRGRNAAYGSLRPEQLAEQLAEAPIAYVPWGALEWHSMHLPVGLDGLVAECIAERAVERTGGVMLPTMYLPITTLPHQFSITFRATTVQAVLDDLFAELARVGFRVVMLLSGHYAQGHELVLMDAAERAIEQHNLLVLATPPLALLGEEYLDHAGRWETAQLLATHPSLVDLRALVRALEQYPAGHVSDLGILGELPMSATAGSGEVVIEQALDAIARWAALLLQSNDPQPLREFYARRRAQYQPFMDRYFNGSHEEAAAAWWSDRVKRD